MMKVQVRILYVRNLSVSTTENQLEKMFNEAIGDNGVDKVKILNDYAFVHFDSRQQAEKVMKAFHGNSQLNFNSILCYLAALLKLNILEFR